jgi:hypothetical protein
MKTTSAVNTKAIERLNSYVQRNPKASDTAEGIAKWWVQMPLEMVLPALEALVELGIWEKLRRDDHVIYRPIRCE